MARQVALWHALVLFIHAAGLDSTASETFLVERLSTDIKFASALSTLLSFKPHATCLALGCLSLQEACPHADAHISLARIRGYLKVARVFNVMSESCQLGI